MSVANKAKSGAEVTYKYGLCFSKKFIRLHSALLRQKHRVNLLQLN